MADLATLLKEELAANPDAIWRHYTEGRKDGVHEEYTLETEGVRLWFNSDAALHAVLYKPVLEKAGLPFDRYIAEFNFWGDYTSLINAQEPYHASVQADSEAAQEYLTSLDKEFRAGIPDIFKSIVEERLKPKTWTNKTVADYQTYINYAFSQSAGKNVGIGVGGPEANYYEWKQDHKVVRFIYNP